MRDLDWANGKIARKAVSLCTLLSESVDFGHACRESCVLSRPPQRQTSGLIGRNGHFPNVSGTEEFSFQRFHDTPAHPVMLV